MYHFSFFTYLCDLFVCLCLFLRCSGQFLWLSTFVRLTSATVWTTAGTVRPEVGMLAKQTRRICLLCSMLMYMYLYMFLPISTLYPSRKMRFKRRAEVGLPVKGMKPLKKLEKNFPYLLCQHSDFGADTAAGCAERDGRSPAKLHRQRRYPNHGGTGKGRYKICKGRQKEKQKNWFN